MVIQGNRNQNVKIKDIQNFFKFMAFKKIGLILVIVLPCLI